MADVKYDAQQLAWIGAVFGDDGVELARNLPLRVGGVSNHTGIPENPEDGPLFVQYTSNGWQRPEIIIHEFAHAYHATRWPDLTAAASTTSCETFAALAEIALVHAYPYFAMNVLRRLLIAFDAATRNRLGQFELEGYNLTLDETAKRVLTSGA